MTREGVELMENVIVLDTETNFFATSSPSNGYILGLNTDHSFIY
jgi:hypothetical protein